MSAVSVTGDVQVPGQGREIAKIREPRAPERGRLVAEGASRSARLAWGGKSVAQNCVRVMLVVGLCGFLGGTSAGADSAANASRPAGWSEIASQSPEDPKTGYRVFERAMPGSEYKAYRIEAVLDAPPERALAATRLRILDQRFVGSGRERRVLRHEGDAVVLYFRTGAPMIDDRDAVTRLEPLRAGGGAMGWQWRSTNAGPKPQPNVVRMPRSEGSWTFRPDGERGSHAVYESFAELGGSIPTWIINRLMVSEQLRELETVRSVLASHDASSLRAALARVDRPSVGSGPER